jgi:hypothetical protein
MKKIRSNLSISREPLSLKRDKSFDALNRLLKRPFKTHKYKETDPNLDKGFRLKRQVIGATVLEAHKHLDYCMVYY